MIASSVPGDRATRSFNFVPGFGLWFFPGESPRKSGPSGRKTHKDGAFPNNRIGGVVCCLLGARGSIHKSRSRSVHGHIG